MEIKDYINVDPQQGGGNDFQRKFKKLVSEKSQVYNKERKPYCTACAWEDFNDKVEDAKKKMIRNASMNITGKELDFNVEVDLESYGKSDLFREIGTRTVNNKVIIQGTRIPIPMYYVDFKCIRGHGYSIEYTEEEYGKLNGAKSKK